MAIPLASAIREFLRLESAAGILLVIAAAISIVLANSPLSVFYTGLLETRISILIETWGISKPLLLWINDGLMAIFFLLVGLEIKREALKGELAGPNRAALLVVAAIGGMVAPALVFWFFNSGHPVRMEGWAIPIATDIAFALGVLSLLGERVPASLKIFLLALAIVDDLGAIVIIAAFYTTKLSALSLVLAGLGIAILVVLNRARVRSFTAYALTGIFVWVCVLKSGVHATLAGVALAFAIPLNSDSDEQSMLERLEVALHPWVSYAILPLFAFANAGVSFAGIGIRTFLDPLVLGIAAGLFVGKQTGVLVAIWTATRFRSIVLPDDISWAQVYGLAVLTGIGFTMSLFIGTLAFEDPQFAAATRLGVLAGSLCSAILGYLVLRLTSPSDSVTPNRRTTR
jgi:Na+:H+ antiporter, NhaA family